MLAVLLELLLVVALKKNCSINVDLCDYVTQKCSPKSFYTGPNMVAAINDGRADVVSIFYSEVPWLFHRKQLRVDVAFIHVSPPDDSGYCSLGVTVDCTRAAVINATSTVALVNKNMPRTFGDGLVHKTHLDVMVEDDSAPIYEKDRHVKPTRIDHQIGRVIADNLVEDGATLRFTDHPICDALGECLRSHRDLGIHSEVMTDVMLDLIEGGAVTNARKTRHPGRVYTSFIYGSKKLYQFVDNNPMILMGDVSDVCKVHSIRTNPKVVAVDTAFEVDITGQIVSTSKGKTILAGFGGQAEFLRGASLCDDGNGRAVIALASTDESGQSTIVPFIRSRAGVTTTRAHVHYVVTEHGVAHLFSKSMRQRAHELIKIAHPKHREQLEQAAFHRLKCMPSP